MFTIWLFLAAWVISAIARQGIVAVVKAIAFTMIAVIVAWHEIAAWLIAPMPH